MTNATRSKSVLALILMLMATSVSNAFAQQSAPFPTTPPTQPSPDDTGGGPPDPTGGGSTGNLTVHSS